MKILAPVSSAYEAQKLIKLGADELYCGLQLNDWKSKFGNDKWMNRRGDKNANIQSIKELKKLVSAAHEHKVSVFLTLNMPYYTEDQHSMLLKVLDDIFNNCSLDALIIGDPGLIMAVKESFPEVEIHVSSLAPVLNSASVSFYKKFSVNRVIFPRYIDLPQLEQTIKTMGSSIETEVFIFNDGCVFEEGFCNVSHALGGAICHNPFQQYSLIKKQGNQIKPKQPYYQHLKDYRSWVWHIRNCNGGSDPKGYPLGMCGLCSIPDLIKLGVTSLKIVGREASLNKKALSVKLVRKALDYVMSCDEKEIDTAKIRSLRGKPKQCSLGYMCYFR